MWACLYVIVTNLLIIVFGGKIMKNKKSLQTSRQTNRIMPAVFRYRMLIIVIFLVALLFVGGATAIPPSTNPDVLTAQNLSDALNISIAGAAYANGDTVCLIQDVPLNYTINITAANPITLTTVNSAPYTIFRNVSSVSLFNVSSGTLILEGNNGNNLTIDGNMTTYGGANGNSLIYVNGGTFDMNAGSVLQNITTPFNGGGGVFVNDGTFNMNGGDISNNNADNSGGGEEVNGSMFTMNGGNISENTAGTGGGGEEVNGGTFNMRSSATVDPDNDVYLDVGTIFDPIKSYINVTGVLASGSGTLNITPWYTNGTVISYNAGVSLGTWTSNFALNQTWASSNPTLALGQSGNDILL